MQNRPIPLITLVKVYLVDTLLDFQYLSCDLYASLTRLPLKPPASTVKCGSHCVFILNNVYFSCATYDNVHNTRGAQA